MPDQRPRQKRAVFGSTQVTPEMRSVIQEHAKKFDAEFFPASPEISKQERLDHIGKTINALFDKSSL